MAATLLIIFVLACVVGVVAWLSAVWHLMRIPFNLKPGVQLWSSGNPFNHLLNTESLTAKGVAARQRLAQSVAAFLGAIVVGAAAGILAKWVAQ